MKKVVINSVLLSSLLFSALAFGDASFAEKVAERQIDAQITFEENNETVPPVDPLEPPEVVDPEGPNPPGTPGPLSIDFASPLKFGKQKITSIDKTYHAAAQKLTDKDGVQQERPNYVQVTDNRGTLKGWTLSVKQDGQFKTETGNELKGAKVTFMNAQAASDSESKDPSTLLTELDLTSDGNGALTNVFSAKNDEGAGTWIYRFGDENTQDSSIKLDVPGKTTKLKDTPYKATITWALSDIPGNS
ncbi:WxL domain-containing protein [Enterococcus plantarum]|uniref:WxL domain-containing protein n=1 Tax=Enterococcus plantarum TaxID=1077675 RepID=UPI001A8DBEDF|nr:WxL domain-containing protein [Enterococcus plantarum]MBO0468689.1 WxL domain-containing protein [Enterococcus plantarum]